MDKRDFLKQEIPLNGKLITSRDAATIGPSNFRQLTNMSYTDTHPLGVGGMTKINSGRPTYRNFLSGIHFKKDQPPESHILVQGWNASLDTPRYVYQNTIDIPGTGNFDGTTLLTETATSGIGKFTLAPNGNVVFANRTGSYIYAGREAIVGAFVNYDPDGAFKRDYREAVQNTDKTNYENYAILVAVPGGVDSYNQLLLHFENTTDDSSASSHHVSAMGGAGFITTPKKFGSYSASLNGTTGYFRTADRSHYTVNTGNFAIEAWVRFRTAATLNPIYYHHNKAASAGAKLYTDANGAVRFRLIASNAATLNMYTTDGKVTTYNWYHVEVDHYSGSYYMFLNGVLQSKRTKSTLPRNYNSSLELGRDRSGNFYSGWMDEYRVSNYARRTGNFEVPTVAYDASTNYTTYCYIGATKALQGFKAYIKTANTTVGVMAVDYWDGTGWLPVAALVDGTSVAGVSLAVTGRVTFTSTDGSAKPKIIDGTYLYWYRVSITECESGTAIYHLTTDAAFQTIKDIWDGINHKILSFQIYNGTTYQEYTTNVYDDAYDSSNDGSYAVLDSMSSSNYFICGFLERQSAVSFYLVATKGNSIANTVCTVSHWNASTWDTVGAIDDGTSQGGISMAKSGVISWNPPDASDEFKTEITKELPLYYYKFQFSKTLDAEVEVYHINGFPAQKTIRGHAYAMQSMNSLWLLNDVAQYKNRALKSSPGTSEVFNGESSLVFFFGDDTALTAGTGLFLQLGSSIYDSTLITKNNETWLVVYDGTQYTQFRVSEDVGCVAPMTMQAVDLAAVDLLNTKRRQVAIWQGSDGIYMYDGSAPACISDDISDYFDANNSYSINRNKIDKSYGFVDVAKGRYHWLSASGTSNTLDKEWAFDLKRNKWLEIDRTTTKSLLSGFPVMDTTGNVYVYGCNRSGYMNRLEYGNSFDGEPITQTMWLGDVAMGGAITEETTVRSVRLIMAAKSNTHNNVVGTYYKDNNTISDETLIFDPTSSGKRLAKPLVPMGKEGPATFHSLKFQCSTDNETVGFEPMATGILYKWARQKISE